MFGKAKTAAIRPRIGDEFDNPFFPALALERQSSRRPIVLLAALSGICLGSLGLSAAGRALVSAPSAQQEFVQTVDQAGKGPRLGGPACGSTALGMDSACRVGETLKPIRKQPIILSSEIASAETGRAYPNVF